MLVYSRGRGREREGEREREREMTVCVWKCFDLCPCTPAKDMPEPMTVARTNFKVSVSRGQRSDGIVHCLMCRTFTGQ